MISRLHLVFGLFAGVALAYGANALITPASMPMQVGEGATPNHDPHHLSLAVATPNHDPHHAGLVQIAATPNDDAGFMQVAATPNHDPHHVGLMESALPAESTASEPVVLRAEPAIAAPSTPIFVAADKTLYAKANARLRAAPNTAAGVEAKLAADTPLRAVARSTDGLWWQVSLAGNRTGYVHRDAVTKVRMAKAAPPAAPASAPVVVATASPEPAPAPRSQGPLAFVSEAMNWLVDNAGPGPAPKIIRAARAD